MIQGIVLWYLIGYVFYLVYMGCKFDHIIKSDVRNGLLWALLGPVWIVVVVIASIEDTIKHM